MSDRRRPSPRRVLISGALIASLFLVGAIGDRLGGAWVLLFPGWLLLLFVAAKSWQRRRNIPMKDADLRFILLLLLTAAATGLVVGGPSYGLMAGVYAGLALLLVFGLERLRNRAG